MGLSAPDSTIVEPGGTGILRAALKAAAGMAVGLVTLGFVSITAAVFCLHLAIRPVLSGSMRPTYGPGWAIVTRPIPVGQVRPGDIIVFSPPGSTAQFAHRVTSVSGGGLHPVVTTKGDANPTVDPWHARLDGPSVPEVVAEVPVVGYLMVDLRRQWVHVLLVAGLGTALCVVGTRAILRGPTRDSATRTVSGPQPVMFTDP